MLQLVDLSGWMNFSKVSTFTKGQNLRQIDAHCLTAGVYIFRIVYTDGVDRKKYIYTDKSFR